MFLLDPEIIAFPDPAKYEPKTGLLAVGGDLSPRRLKLAYEIGLFPWFNEGEDILWWCPNPRFVLFPAKLKISKSMQKVLKKEQFQFTENKCFREVLVKCQKIKRKGQDGTWLSDEFIDSLVQLHQQNIAQSIEVWQNEKLVGGFYGLKIGKVFCGESMFSEVSNTSKAGFINFVLNNKNNFDLIDCQIHSDHLESLGAEMISKKDYLKILNKQHEA
jgi:leucyl/phenylalanyl-tRNA--protein transferase